MLSGVGIHILGGNIMTPGQRYPIDCNRTCKSEVLTCLVYISINVGMSSLLYPKFHMWKLLKVVMLDTIIISVRIERCEIVWTLQMIVRIEAVNFIYI